MCIVIHSNNHHQPFGKYPAPALKHWLHHCFNQKWISFLLNSFLMWCMIVLILVLNSSRRLLTLSIPSLSQSISTFSWNPHLQHLPLSWLIFEPSNIQCTWVFLVQISQVDLIETFQRVSWQHHIQNVHLLESASQKEVLLLVGVTRLQTYSSSNFNTRLSGM